ncbi:MAG: DUF4147 domain-containing protein, partial [Planctomycetota bacterium]
MKQDALAIWKSGVAAVNGRDLVRNAIKTNERTFSILHHRFLLENLNQVTVIGFGKASAAMGLGLEDAFCPVWDRMEWDRLKWKSRIHVPDHQAIHDSKLNIVGCRPPGKNLPTQHVLDSTEKLIQLIGETGAQDLIICLISGGGSALLELPDPPLTLDDLRRTTQWLSQSGASIEELNTVRRSISQVKAGRLLSYSSATW